MMKLFAVLVAVVSLAVGAAIVIGGRGPKSESRPAVPLMVASPADSFVVHDAAPAPAAPAPAPPPPAASPATGTAPPADTSLEATIERLRASAAKPDPAPAPPAPSVIPPPTIPAAPALVDPLLAGPNPAASILAGPPPPPPHNWTAVTTQGVRWHGGRTATGPTVVIDMGAGRTATVDVDPAFQALALTVANARVDFLKETILESFPPGSTRFRFDRDGSVALLR